MHEGARARLRTGPLAKSDLIHLRWAIPPLLVLVLANLLFELTGGGYGELGRALLQADAGTSAGPARAGILVAASLGWATVTLVYLAISVGTAVAAWRVLNARVRGRARRPFILFAVAATLLGLLNLVVVDRFDLPLEAVFQITMDALVQEPSINARYAFFVGAIVVGINLFSTIVPALFLAAGAATALPPVAGWDEATLVRRSLQVRQIVAVAAAYMVAGVLHMGAWTHWAGATLSADAQDLLDFMAVKVTFFWGTTFTLMIASFYVPVTLRLRELAEQVMDDTDVPMADRQQWLVDRGLSFRLGQQLPQLLAIASPLVAGQLGVAVGASAGLFGP